MVFKEYLYCNYAPCHVLYSWIDSRYLPKDVLKLKLYLNKIFFIVSLWILPNVLNIYLCNVCICTLINSIYYIHFTYYFKKKSKYLLIDSLIVSSKINLFDYVIRVINKYY